MRNFTGFLSTPLALLLASTLWSFGCDDGAASGDKDSGGTGTEDMGPGGDSGGGGADMDVGGTNCFGDAECNANEYCAKEDGALEGVCREGCRDDDSCSEGEVCDPASRDCVVPPCESDDDCPADGEYCGPDALCIADPCVPGADCDSDGAAGICGDDHECKPVFACCDTGANTCSMEAAGTCAGLAFESPNVVCSPTLCETATNPCENDDVCPEDAYCNLTDGVCVPGCRTDDPAACPDDQVCDPLKHTCQDLPCDTDDECPDHMYCDPEDFLCRSGCRDDESCPEGEICDLTERECVPAGCEADDDCVVDGQYCDEEAAICRDNCEGHADCNPGEFCNPGNNECVNGCRDDDFEPNDDLASATEIELIAGLANTRNGLTEGAIACQNNADVWAIEANQGELIQVDVIFEQPQSYTLSLGGEIRGEEIEGLPLEAEGLGASHRFRFPQGGVVLDAATYYLTVNAEIADDTGVPYRVEVTAISGPDGACFPDARDLVAPGDNTPETAFPLGGNGGNEEGSICANDQDWFAIDLALNDGIEIELIADGAAGDNGAAVPADLSLILLSESRLANPGNAQFRDDDGEEGAEGTVYTIAVPEQQAQLSNETWYIRVQGALPGNIADYRLSVRRLGVAACEDDGYEDNNNIATGTELANLEGVGDGNEVIANTPELVAVPGPTIMCPLDVDLYCLDLGADNALEVEVSGDAIAGAIHYEIVDENGIRQGQDGTFVNGQEPETASVFGPPAGRYCIRVDGLEAATGAYELRLRRRDGLAGCAADVDELEQRNDTANTALPMPDVSAGEGRRYEVLTGLLCDADGSDEDWYRFNVPEANSRVCVMVNGFENDRADIDAEVYRATPTQGAMACNNDDACLGGLCIANRCAAPLAFATSSNDAEAVNIPKNEIGPRNGDHLIRVLRGDEGERQPYRVTASVEPEQECVADWQELGDNNDNEDRATNLGAGHAALCDTWLCAGEQQGGDWYDLTIPAGEDRTVLVEFAHATDGRVFLEYLPGGELNDEGYRFAEDNVANYQCLNIGGGAMERQVKVHVYSPQAPRADGDNRIDYSLRIVPTDLDARPSGECGRLSANPGREPCMGQFDDNCWPWHQLP